MKIKLYKTDAWYYLEIICVYIMVCIGVIGFSFKISDDIVIDNNLVLMDNTIGLMAEKTNNSISVMTGYVEGASALLSSHESLDFNERYKEITADISQLPYMSIGFVDTEGNIYGNASEKLDLVKYNFINEAKKSIGVYITKPYRAIGAGTNVITMFDTIRRGNRIIGYVFITYPLTQIQSVTNTDALDAEAEVFIMNSRSGNYIRCTKTDNYAVGSWNNILMEKSDMEGVEGYSIDEWQRAMIDGEDSETVLFKFDGRLYTQAFKSIKGMDGWYIVVRIPSEYLSSGINETVKVLGVTLGLLLAATLLLAALLLRKEIFQKNKLKEISVYDPLTRVLNRRAFYAIIHRYIGERNRKPSTLIYIDMDEFKPINDKYGHDAGDKMLVAFAAALKDVFKDCGDTVRMGGDEFVVFIQKETEDSFIDQRLSVFRDKLKNVQIEGIGEFNVSCSIGIARYPLDTAEPEMLEKYADKALYYVKNNGKGFTARYDEINADE